MATPLILLFFLNILFVGALWHLDVHHNMVKLGDRKKTEGFFKITPEAAYRYSQYVLILSLLLIDILFVLTFLSVK